MLGATHEAKDLEFLTQRQDRQPGIGGREVLGTREDPGRRGDRRPF